MSAIETLEEDLARELVNAAPVALLLVDPSAHIVFANAQTEAMFGRTRADVAGQPLALLVPGHCWEAHTVNPSRLSGAPISIRRPRVFSSRTSTADART
jgi:PAS domain S-box-containing protein